MTFESHLIKEGYRPETVGYILRNSGYFLSWLDKEGSLLEDVNHGILMDYIRFCSSLGNKPKTINGKIKCVSHLLAYQGIHLEKIPKVEGSTKRRIYVPIAIDDLERIYHSYPTKTTYDLRYKVMLGLLIYQALRPKELGILHVDDIDLKGKKIHIPAVHDGVERSLDLTSSQVRQIGAYTAVLPPFFNGQGSESRKLFETPSSQLSDLLKYLLKKIKKCHPGIMNYYHIRSSIISHWLKSYSLRETQLMAGHRWISSTEKLLENDVEGLQWEVERLML